MLSKVFHLFKVGHHDFIQKYSKCCTLVLNIVQNVKKIFTTPVNKEKVKDRE